MSVAVASLGEILRIKPVLKMNKGDATAERVRTTRRAIELLIELLKEIQPLEELYLVHTFSPDKLEILREKAAPLYNGEDELLAVPVTPVLGAHLGPGAYGFSCVACGTDVCQPHSMTEGLIRMAKNIRG